jgi:hypothetical protein
MGRLTVSGVFQGCIGCLSHRITAFCLTVSGVSRHPFPPPVGGLTIEITQIPVFFGQFAF